MEGDDGGRECCSAATSAGLLSMLKTECCYGRQSCRLDFIVHDIDCEVVHFLTVLWMSTTLEQLL